MTSPFLERPPTEWVASNPLAFALRDAFPVSPGHTLVIPRRLVATWFDATPDEQRALWDLVDVVKRQLDASHTPDGYNVGFNAGVAAGQTVMHLHVHVIPRYRGDMDDPRGGVRGVIPGQQKYGTDSAAPAADPFSDLPEFLPGQGEALGVVLREAARRSDAIDLLSAFVQPSGLDELEGDLLDALRREARVRVLTSDYLGVTHPHALHRLYTLTTAWAQFQARLWRVDHLTFHPKAYVFRSGEHGVAFVGSSNLSRSALVDGVEWSLRAVSSRQAATYARIVARFGGLWDSPRAAPLTPEVLAAYAAVVRAPPSPEPSAPRPEPHAIQREVLVQLRSARTAGAKRGLVVMATGLGKTYLSAFDFAALGGQRALFVAHRQEILEQAAQAWRLVFPDRTIGLLDGDRKDVDADLVFASVATLSRSKTLLGFGPEHFDYVVVDEFHHASAGTYRKVLAHFAPRFLLGLTATPDRTDGASLLELCHHTLVARVGIVEGVTRGFLSPFRYYGVKDELDYEHIPWRSGRFDEAQLTEAASTHARATQALRELRRHAPGRRRVLAFCVSTAHADFMARWLRDQGVSAAAVHSASTSAPRTLSLQRLRAGELEVLCAVDVFNEGLDVPHVDAVLMLRPTESPVIFLQQLGRGLRRAEGKEALVIVDFIGNHRSFLLKPTALLALTGQEAPPGAALRQIRAGLPLPPGCSVEIETDALDLLERLSHLSSDDRLIYQYTTLRDALGHRPTASEVYAAGVNLDPVRQRYGTWQDFVASQGDLAEPEQRLLEALRPWFSDLLRTRMSRSYKMVALLELLERGALVGGMGVRELALASRERMAGDVLLRQELAEHEAAGARDDDFVQRWRAMPLQVLAKGEGLSRRWFELGDRFRATVDVAEDDRELFEAMTEEVVALRLREYKSRLRHTDDVLPFTAPIRLQVSHRGGNPVLRFDRTRRADLPTGEASVEVDGRAVRMWFDPAAVLTASDGTGPNVLPSMLRRWFGPHTGLPGTRHEVELERVGERLRLRAAVEVDAPAQVVPFPRLPYFPDLQVACGPSAPGAYEQADRKSWVAVDARERVEARSHFLVRASGDSMDGGAAPIHDGDLVLCAWTSPTRPEEFEGRPCLLQGLSGGLPFASIKVPRRVGGAWQLHSWNPAVPPIGVDEETTLRVVARVIGAVEPASGLVLWARYDRDAIARQFGSQYGRPWQVGHLDLMVGDAPHTVLMVTLHKEDLAAEHAYADRFLSPAEFQWESQNQTAPSSTKGRNVTDHVRQGRTVHLFVRWHNKTTEQKGEPFVYCGPLRYVRHEGSEPMRVWWAVERPLPQGLWLAWST